VKVPVLLIHSKQDKYVLPENMEWIYRELVNVRDRTKLYVSNSGHVITRDAARQQAFNHVAEFIGRLESAST
jgi:esterase/lipase